MKIEQQIIEKQDELIAWLVKYTEPESFRYNRFCDEIKDLKAQLKEQKEEYETCLVCGGAGINHYMDNDPCFNCHGDGFVKVKSHQP